MMLKKRIIAGVFVFASLVSALHAETKVEIYKIPLGTFMKVNNADDVESLTSSLSKVEPTIQYTRQSKDRMLNFGSVKVFLKDNNAKKENYNKLLEIVSKFSKEIPDLDHKIVEKTLNRLKVK